MSFGSVVCQFEAEYRQLDAVLIALLDSSRGVCEVIDKARKGHPLFRCRMLPRRFVASVDHQEAPGAATVVSKVLGHELFLDILSERGRGSIVVGNLDFYNRLLSINTQGRQGNVCAVPFGDLLLARDGGI